MAEEVTPANVALTTLKVIEDGIDYIVSQSQMFVDPAGNSLRVLLFNARQIAVQMQDSVQEPASAEAIAGTAASGTTAAANVAGTGAEPATVIQAGVASPPAGLVTDWPKPEGIDQATWDAMNPDARAAVFASLGTQAPAPPVSPRALPQEPAQTPQDATPAEDQAPAQTPPWVAPEGSPAA